MRKIYAHTQIVHTAMELARAEYSNMMARDNALYADWKKTCPELTPEKAEELFVELRYPKLLEAARATMAGILNDPTKIHLHESIYDALCKDYILRHGRIAPQGRARVHVGADGTPATITRH